MRTRPWVCLRIPVNQRAILLGVAWIMTPSATNRLSTGLVGVTKLVAEHTGNWITIFINITRRRDVPTALQLQLTRWFRLELPLFLGWGTEGGSHPAGGIFNHLKSSTGSVGSRLDLLHVGSSLVGLVPAATLHTIEPGDSINRLLLRCSRCWGCLSPVLHSPFRGSITTTRTSAPTASTTTATTSTALTSTTTATTKAGGLLGLGTISRVVTLLLAVITINSGHVTGRLVPTTTTTSVFTLDQGVGSGSTILSQVSSKVGRHRTSIVHPGGRSPLPIIEELFIVGLGSLSNISIPQVLGLHSLNQAGVICEEGCSPATLDQTNNM